MLIIDHLTRVRSGQPELLLDVREALAPPQDHGITPSQALASAWRCDVARADDADLIRELVADRDPVYAAWWHRWVTLAPEHVLVVRRSSTRREVVAATVWATSTSLPRVFAEDPVLARWWAAARDWSGPTLYNPATEITAEPPDQPEVGALLLTSLVRRCGLPDFRRWVVPRNPPAPDPRHCGGTCDDRFDVVIGAVRLVGHVIDYGPGGLVAWMREEAYDALSLASARTDASGWLGTAPTADVRDALRHCHDPVWLASSALAQGADPAARAASVLDVLHEALGQAFGDGPDARLQRDVLLLGYLDPDANHARAMRTLHLSRTTYFRRLREATATLALWLTAQTP